MSCISILGVMRTKTLKAMEVYFLPPCGVEHVALMAHIPRLSLELNYSTANRVSMCFSLGTHAMVFQTEVKFLWWLEHVVDEMDGYYLLSQPVQ